jgi:YfiH family protein
MVRLPTGFEMNGEQIAIDLPGACAVFTTRRGGVSQGPYESLNLGRLTDDAPDAVQANLRTLSERFGVRLAWGRQVHGAQVVWHDGDVPADPSPSPVEGDGRITVEPGIAPMVLTADCLAVIVAGHGGVSALHAGWRGLAAGVIGAGVRRLREAGVTGTLEAAIGPHARVCCYEVGHEVHEVFAAAGYGEARAGRNLDMTQVARRQLEDAGVSAVHDLGLCTMCSDPTLFFSHRRDQGVTGRQAGLAWCR